MAIAGSYSVCDDSKWGEGGHWLGSEAAAESGGVRLTIAAHDGDDGIAQAGHHLG